MGSATLATRNHLSEAARLLDEAGKGTIVPYTEARLTDAFAAIGMAMFAYPDPAGPAGYLPAMRHVMEAIKLNREGSDAAFRTQLELCKQMVRALDVPAQAWKSNT